MLKNCHLPSFNYERYFFNENFSFFSGLRSSCASRMDNSSLSCSSPSLPSGYSSVDLLDEVEVTDERKQRGGMFECRDSKHEGGVLTRSQSIPGLKYLLSPVLTTLVTGEEEDNTWTTSLCHSSSYNSNSPQATQEHKRAILQRGGMKQHSRRLGYHNNYSPKVNHEYNKRYHIPCFLVWLSY